MVWSFFDCSGNKLNTDIEKDIENIFYNDNLLDSSQVTHQNIGKAKRIDDVIGRYIVSIKSSFPVGQSLSGLRIVLDCANGAAYKVGPTIFDELGADLIVLNDAPDGFNINNECGALYPQKLGQQVKKLRADIGIALDGDADRLVIVDENGETIDGDKLIGALAVYLNSQGKLPSSSCVATVMSNVALENYLEENGIELFRSNVGDKYVLQIMKEKNIKFGGEQSGHIIFSDVAKTGDGLASALQVLAMIMQSGKKASEVLNPFELSPQILKNLLVEEKKPLDEIEGLEDLLNKFRAAGLRDLIRYSGTEKKIRLLLEGDNKTDVEKSMDELVEFIKQRLC